MKSVELYRQVRHSVRIEGLSRRETGRRFGLDPRAVAKTLAFSVPPGYPAALAKAYPQEPLRFDHLKSVAMTLEASPVMEDK